MTIYIIMWILIVVASYFASRSNYKVQYFVFFSFCLMTLVLGMRGANVGEDSDEKFEIIEDVLKDEQRNKKIIDSFDRVPKEKRIKMKLRCFLYKSFGKTKYINIMRKRKNSDGK